MISCWTTLLVIVICASLVGTQNVSKINVSPNKSVTWDNRELYSEFIHINRMSTIQVGISDVGSNVSFIIFQVHSHLYNVTVFKDVGSKVTGTNIGLYSNSLVKKIDVFNIYNQNEYVDLDLLISVHGYNDKDPIPGGCNMEFPIPVSPYMRTDLSSDIIRVYAPPPRHPKDKICTQINALTSQFYIMYLPERDFEAKTYFDGIKKMMTLENIKANGDIIPVSRNEMSRMLSAYPGTGAVYVVVTMDKANSEYYSIYTPTYSYACSPLEDDGCEGIDDNLSKFVCASLIFVGVFICYFGHRFFKTEMFLFGWLSGVIISYVIISLMSNLDRPVLIAGSLMSGAFFGAIWLTFSWYYGIPVIAVSLPALNLGFLISSILYNQFPGGLLMLQDDFNFWTLFIIVMILSSILLVSLAFISNILCCAVLGAYAVVFPIDYYLGSNLRYIIINTIRRATVYKFSRTTLMPPFQWRDSIIVVLWVALAVSGFLFQHFHNRGRPPFPPPPRSVRPGMPEPPGYGALPIRRNVQPTSGTGPVGASGQHERTPLLA